MSSILTRSLAQNIGPIAWRGEPIARADTDMRLVLEKLAAMDPKPYDQCTPREARKQPRLHDAAESFFARQGGNPVGDLGVDVETVSVDGAAGPLYAKLYRPRDALAGRRPLLLWLPDGMFVLPGMPSAEATVRNLVRRTGAIALLTETRMTPENPWPAARDDAVAAWAWLRTRAGELGGDLTRAALGGEGSGAALALHAALSGPRPSHLVLVTPLADTDDKTDSFAAAGALPPFTADALRWFFAQAGDVPPLAERSDLSRLPPTTIVLAELDPLRSGGEALAHALRRSGVWVDATTWDGVAHGFFGLGALVNKAMFAQSQVARTLSLGFSAPGVA